MNNTNTKIIVNIKQKHGLKNTSPQDFEVVKRLIDYLGMENFKYSKSTKDSNSVRKYTEYQFLFNKM